MGNNSGRIRLKAIALPSEHGGWSFLLEPILLGMLVTPTLTGVCFSIAATAGFLLRHPLKLFLRNRKQRPRSRRDRITGLVALGYAMITIAGLVSALLISGWTPFVPFVLVCPFTAVYFLYDTKHQARRLLPELSGPLALAAVASSISLAANGSWSRASVLWILLMARTIPSIFYVRARLRLERGQPIPRSQILWLHLGFLCVVIVFAWSGLAPLMVLAGLMILTLRAFFGLSSRRRLTKARQIGTLEIFFGLIYILMIAVGFLGDL